MGCLPDMSLDFKGLTVISGLNSTGKSTILKAVYSTLSPAIYFDSVKNYEIADALGMILINHGESFKQFYGTFRGNVEIKDIDAMIDCVKSVLNKDDPREVQLFSRVQKL